MSAMDVPLDHQSASVPAAHTAKSKTARAAPLIVNNFLSYSGMEMNAVHVGSLRNPRKEFPRSMFLAMGLVLLIFILPALAISWVVPAEQLSLTAGIMQAFDAIFAHFGSQWLTPLIGIIVVGLLIFQSGKESRDADAKADQLTSQLQQFGLRTPSKDQIVRVLGDDGGAVCANPNNALTRAALAAQLTNGAGGPGMRPVIADTRFLQGQLAIISVYCPDQLQAFQEYRDRLETAKVVR